MEVTLRLRNINPTRRLDLCNWYGFVYLLPALLIPIQSGTIKGVAAKEHMTEDIIRG